MTELPITEEDDKLSFPWFTTEPDPDEVRAYTHFITALCEMARNQKRVTAKEKETDNDKYAFRCFLLRLGFIGTDYKTSAQSCSAIFPAAPPSVTAHRQRRCQYASDFKRTPAGTV